jgi:hypothetical protein
MLNRSARNGYLCFGLGFFFSSIASFLDRFAGAAPVANFIGGALDGLSVVAFAVAIFVSIRALRRED